MSARTTRRWIIVLVVLQVLVIALMPLRAGPRIPPGTTVTLRATIEQPPHAGGSEPFDESFARELWLDYGFGRLDAPDGVQDGEELYVELLGARDGDEPMRPGRVFADRSDLDDVTTWIQLREDRGHVGSDPIQVWFDEDERRASRPGEQLDVGDEVDVLIELDRRGYPTIEGVEPAR